MLSELVGLKYMSAQPRKLWLILRYSCFIRTTVNVSLPKGSVTVFSIVPNKEPLSKNFLGNIDTSSYDQPQAPLQDESKVPSATGI